MDKSYISIFQSKALENPNWDFWYENIPSDNPGQVQILLRASYG
jgi:hypothetical protein